MSNSTATAVYLAIAVLHWTVACWKGSALLRSPTLALGLQVATHTLGGLNYVMASPWGYRTIGDATGHPWFPTLPIYLGIVVCFAVQHLLTIVWTEPRPDQSGGLRRQLVTWTVAYAVGLTIMIVEFAAADLDGPADPLKFNTEQVDEPHVAIFLSVFLIMLACSTLTPGLRARRAQVDDETLRYSVRWYGISYLVSFGYFVCSAPAVAAAATGHHQLDGIGVLGSAFGVAGSILTCYGVSGAVVSTWRRERRDIAVLQPLWDLVVAGVDGKLVLGARERHPERGDRPEASTTQATAASPLFNVRWTLHRRVIEILDGIRRLERSGMVYDQPAQAVMALHAEALKDPVLRSQLGVGDGGLAPLELEAVTTAAVLRDAVDRLQAADPDSPAPASPTGLVAGFAPGKQTPAADERRRLVRVAQALQHPLTESALQVVQAVHDGQQATQTSATPR